MTGLHRLATIIMWKEERADRIIKKILIEWEEVPGLTMVCFWSNDNNNDKDNYNVIICPGRE